MRSFLLLVFLSVLPLLFSAGHDEVRLVKGGSPCAGTVEVNRGGQWGTIMQFGWDMNDATVVCRELGCGSAVATPGRAHFGEGSGMELISLVSCNGSEPKLSLCPSQEAAPISKFIRHPHILDAGVTCTEPADVRLVNGSSPCSGRVEVFRWGEWGTVYQRNWDMNDAAVVCRQLGCGSAVSVPGAAHFGEGSGRMVLGDVSCSGSESALRECGSLDGREHDLPHTLDAAVICSDHVSLVGGADRCSGWLEVKFSQSWATVCDGNFDWQDAEVVCRELDCGAPSALHKGAQSDQGEGPIWSKGFHCDGEELFLHECFTSAKSEQNCEKNSNIRLICTGPEDLRLVNGSSPCSGRVEVYRWGEWGTIAQYDWDLDDASVVCRQLGCGTAVLAPIRAHFGEGSGRVLLRDVSCSGSESALRECRSLDFHGEDAGVICSGSTPSSSVGGVRLLSGGSDCEGWVEVYYNQTWQKVHQESWSSMDASVVCRQLGCGSATNIYRSYLSRTGDSDKCVTGFHCSGTESHLGKCRPPHVLNCRPSDQVSMVCSNHRSLRLVGEGSDCAGRLEVFHRGSWGTVCHESWGLPEAQVVCRQLRCGTALSGQIPVPTYFGPGTGPIWLSKLGCGGNESSLWDCPSVEWGRKDCGHKQDVGVVCSEHKVLRLSEGCSGHTEVYYNGSWGSVCFDGLEQPTVAVICHQLGCGDKGTVTYTMSRLHPDLNGLDFGKCRSHDTSLWQCPSSSKGPNGCSEAARTSCSDSEKPKSPPDFMHCQASSDQTLCNNHPPLRLTEGADTCSGRVEVYHSGSWGTVCGDSWDVRDAMVVCRQLGCGPALRAEWAGRFGRGDGAIWLDEVNCKGSELHLWHCSYSLKQSDCSHRQDAGVTCAGVTEIIPDVTGPPTVTQFKPSQSDPTVSSVVIGLLVSVLLLLQFRLLYRNWVLRRELNRNKQLSPAIYEEIDYRFTKRIKDASQKGSDLPDELPSGYEDVGEAEGGNLFSNDEKTATGYDPENHVDLICEKENPENLKGTLEYYNDTPTDQTHDYDDVAVSQSSDYNIVSVKHHPASQPDLHHSNPIGHKTKLSSTKEGRLPNADIIDYGDVEEGLL
nr:antigen WC1.1-like [Paramormyrops kingsleyae]